MFSRCILVLASRANPANGIESALNHMGIDSVDGVSTCFIGHILGAIVKLTISALGGLLDASGF